MINCSLLPSYVQVPGRPQMWISLYYIVDIDVMDELIEQDWQRKARIDLVITRQGRSYLGPGLGVDRYREGLI